MKTNPISKVLFIVLALVLGFATYQSIVLSLSELKAPGTCPAIGPVPACYIVLTGYGLALIGHLLTGRKFASRLFVFGLAIPTLLAVVGTIGQLAGLMECPKAGDGTPMCFISLAMCTVCWILWLLIRKFR